VSKMIDIINEEKIEFLDYKRFDRIFNEA
jgi:hypothetical protein